MNRSCANQVPALAAHPFQKLGKATCNTQTVSKRLCNTHQESVFVVVVVVVVASVLVVVIVVVVIRTVDT